MITISIGIRKGEGDQKGISIVVILKSSPMRQSLKIIPLGLKKWYEILGAFVLKAWPLPSNLQTLRADIVFENCVHCFVWRATSV